MVNKDFHYTNICVSLSLCRVACAQYVKLRTSVRERLRDNDDDDDEEQRVGLCVML